MTEAEAKTRWCPMVRVHVVGIGNWTNRGLFLDGKSTMPNRCIASDCMMWRFDGLRSSIAQQEHGYCGLAGMPYLVEPP